MGESFGVHVIIIIFSNIFPFLGISGNATPKNPNTPPNEPPGIAYDK